MTTAANNCRAGGLGFIKSAALPMFHCQYSNAAAAWGNAAWALSSIGRGKSKQPMDGSLSHQPDASSGPRPATS